MYSSERGQGHACPARETILANNRLACLAGMLWCMPLSATQVGVIWSRYREAVIIRVSPILIALRLKTGFDHVALIPRGVHVVWNPAMKLPYVGFEGPAR